MIAILAFGLAVTVSALCLFAGGVVVAVIHTWRETTKVIKATKAGKR